MSSIIVVAVASVVFPICVKWFVSTPQDRREWYGALREIFSIRRIRRVLLPTLVLISLTGCAAKKARVGDLQFSYPISLAVLPPYMETAHGGDPEDRLFLNNFRGNYIHGGLLPKNGIEVSALAISAKIIEMGQMVHLDTENCASDEETPLRIQNLEAMRVACENDFGVHHREYEKNLYLTDGEMVYRITVTRNSADSNSDLFNKIFRQIERSIKLPKQKRVE